MPVAIFREQIEAAPSVLEKRTWTRRDCELLEKAGAFDGRRYELINGELIDKMGMNPPQAVVLQFLMKWLNRIFGDDFVRIRMPIVVERVENPSSEPEPDACVTVKSGECYRSANPGAEEIRLVVEVSDSTLALDTTTKSSLYALAGIQDYWVLDVKNRRTIVHRSPLNGEYQSLTIYEAAEPVRPITAPEAGLVWADLRY